MTLVGQRKSSAEVVRRGRHAETQAAPLPNLEGRSDIRSQRVCEMGTMGKKRRRRNGCGKEALFRILSAEAVGGQVTCQSEGGSWKSTGAEAYQEHQDAREVRGLTTS